MGHTRRGPDSANVPQALHCDDLLAQFDRHLVRLDTSPQTQRTYRQTLRRFFRVYPEVPLDRFTPEQIEEYLYGRKLAPSSFVTELKVFRVFFAWCIAEKRLLRGNPCLKVQRPRVRQTYRPAPTFAEFEALRRVCKTLEEAAMVELLYFSGLRVSEFRALRWRDVNLEEGWARVWRGKGRKARIVAFDGRVTALLRARHFSDARPEDWLFASPRHPGRGRCEQWIQKTLRRLAKTAGLPYDVTVHILRHGWFRLTKKAGVPISQIMRLGGHENMVTTDRLYGRLDDDDALEAYRQYVGAFLARQKGA